MDPSTTEANPSALPITADTVGWRVGLTAEFAQLRAEMREMKVDIIRAMVFPTAAIVGLNVALLKLLP